ncbi:uncharacterized protein LOC111085744 isoform X1 [Limulus polyphemus]|uniref:Uncharacterized protein LOC111085744 isoform X1 n=1 Tax=Limulus polyphemus TaxID=6850 RepID=A0ABM1SCV6_LIMPO|nr:uncharacterized protein LOC111085744 isoform X1 [Limulus polyphemus]
MFLYQAAVLILFMVVVNQECEGTFDIDEPCGYLGMCHINNSYCNEKKRCACKPDYPLYIIGKTCSKAIHRRQGCISSIECEKSDRNTFCSRKKGSICECKPGYIFDTLNNSCKGEDNVQSYVIMFIILIIMAFGLTIGIIFLFCRIKRKKRNIQTSELSCCGKTVLGRMEQSRSHEPVEEPPPTYEEAVAIDFPSDIMENNLSPNELNYEQYYCPSAPTYCK